MHTSRRQFMKTVVANTAAELTPMSEHGIRNSWEWGSPVIDFFFHLPNDFALNSLHLEGSGTTEVYVLALVSDFTQL